jgi:hypothetical protein
MSPIDASAVDRLIKPDCRLLAMPQNDAVRTLKIVALCVAPGRA